MSETNIFRHFENFVGPGYGIIYYSTLRKDIFQTQVQNHSRHISDCARKQLVTLNASTSASK